ncbi:MAG: hypothetical protein QXG00_01625 [Candidatus Woesearchaeota archaeon]
MNTTINFEEIVSFVFEFENKKGGFSFARTTEKTIEDTYYALKILQEIDYKYENNKTLEYIKHMNTKSINNTEKLYRIIWLKKYFNIGIDTRIPAFRIIFQKSLRDTKKLDDTHYAMQIAEIIKKGL